MFNTHGQLLEKMGKWHVEKYRADKGRSRSLSIGIRDALFVHLPRLS